MDELTAGEQDLSKQPSESSKTIKQNHVYCTEEKTGCAIKRTRLGSLHWRQNHKITMVTGCLLHCQMRAAHCTTSLNELRISWVPDQNVLNETLCADLKTKSDCTEASTGCL